MAKKTSGKSVKKGLIKKQASVSKESVASEPKKRDDVIGKPKGGAKALEKEKSQITAEAIADILEGISKPEFQNGVKAYIPKAWKERYKDSLGPYKKFLREHPDKFAIVEHDAFNFTIMKVGEDAPKPKQKQKIKVKMPWAKTLLKAFMAWCKATPKSERSFADFMAAIPTDKEPTPVPDNSDETGEKESEEGPATKEKPASEGVQPAKKKKKMAK